MMLVLLIHTIDGGGKMDWNNPVGDEEDEEETLGPKIWSNDEEEELDTEFFLSMAALFNFMSTTCVCVCVCVCVQMYLYLKGLVLCRYVTKWWKERNERSYFEKFEVVWDGRYVTWSLSSKLIYRHHYSTLCHFMTIFATNKLFCYSLFWFGNFGTNKHN